MYKALQRTADPAMPRKDPGVRTKLVPIDSSDREALERARAGQRDVHLAALEDVTQAHLDKVEAHALALMNLRRQTFEPPMAGVG